jgi:LemA protein
VGTLIFLAVLAVVVIYAVMVYNGLVNVKHAVSKAWANIDVLLKQRHDELPKLIEVCKQYKQFEQETLGRSSRALARPAGARSRTSARSVRRKGIGGRPRHAVRRPACQAEDHQNYMRLRPDYASRERIADRRELWRASHHQCADRQFPDGSRGAVRFQRQLSSSTQRKNRRRREASSARRRRPDPALALGLLTGGGRLGLGIGAAEVVPRRSFCRHRRAIAVGWTAMFGATVRSATRRPPGRLGSAGCVELQPRL